jgi:two-component system response regulator YesN
VLKYVEENYDRDISLSEAARVALITPNYLSRIFKEEMDINFTDWLNQLRVDKAKDLLMRTNLKTYEVAEKVGYRDYKYFSGVFKKITGSPPKEFKQGSGNLS